MTNKLCLYLSSTKEIVRKAPVLLPSISFTKIVFHRPHLHRLCLTSATVCDVKRVQSAKLFGIYAI